MNFTIKYSLSINNINSIINQLEEKYTIKKKEVKKNGIFEIYYKDKIVYTLLDDFNYIELNFKYLHHKIEKYLVNSNLKNSSNNSIRSDNIGLDEY